MKNISCKKLRELTNEELKTSKQYKSYGWKSQSKDEKRHSNFIKKEFKKKCK